MNILARIAIAFVLMSFTSSVAMAQSTRVVRFTDEIIRGKVYKPEVMMLITRQNLNTNYKLELRESFLPKVIDSVDLQPF